MVLVGVHIPGMHGAADALSRDKLDAFRLQVPGAKRVPTPIPPAVLQALVVEQPDWMAVSWTSLLTSTS